MPAEFSNWRDEQHAWRDTCCLFDQSHHMTDMYIKGPEALKLLSDLGVNSFATFAVDKAKQFVAVNHDGYVIGDAILFYLDEDLFNLVGRPSAHNWVQYHCETGGYDATIERDERSAVNPGTRKLYRYQIQGPKRSRCSKDQPRAVARDQVLQHGELTSRAGRSAPCTTACPACPDSSSSARGRRATRSRPRSSKPVRSSGCCRWARGSMPRTRSSRAGSRPAAGGLHR